jgi:transketolase
MDTGLPMEMNHADTVSQAEMANAIRALAMDAVEAAKSGHPGMPMGMADVATVLWTQFLTFDPTKPDWADRDRFVLSAGHGSMLLYALLHLTGYRDMTIEELKRFRQLGSVTAGHPEYGHAAGIETTTGPLGQGLANAVGMALAERILAEQHGAALVDHYTYVMAGDGCLMEGISHEAASLAGHLELGKLIVFFDDNAVTIDGASDLASSEDTKKRFEAYGWHVQGIDGHDQEAIARAIKSARKSDKPSLIACKTTIGFGAPSKQGTASVHGAPLGEDETAAARKTLGWPHEPFVVPARIKQAFEAAGARGREVRLAWERRFMEMDIATRAKFGRSQAGGLCDSWRSALEDHCRKLVDEKPVMASREASQAALEVLTQSAPNIIGGSADLTDSNKTQTAATEPLAAGDFAGRYIHYGVREHAMAAIMNGIALHKGLVPYGGTFLVFSDYARHAIRLSALMGLRVIYVLTHDSIGLGEDGPTHQPVEHLASLRAMPNLDVYRPADAVETAECWALALTRRDGPSVLALSRQTLPAVRTVHSTGNLSERGAYILADATGKRAVTILATGSEVQIALDAKTRLDDLGFPTAVVSMPCQERFEQQPEDYRANVLGSAPRLAIEAASPFGWTRYVKSEDDVVGMAGFGASAPAEDLYQHFGITAEALVERALLKIDRPDARGSGHLRAVA